MFYVQFKTHGKEAIQTISIKKYKQAKKVYQALVRAKQLEVKLMDHQAETLLTDYQPKTAVEE